MEIGQQDELRPRTALEFVRACVERGITALHKERVEVQREPAVLQPSPPPIPPETKSWG